MADQTVKKIDKYTFSVNQVLGKGAFGEVFRGKHEETGKQVAVKMINKKMIQADDYLLKGLLQEINIMKKLESIYIVKLEDVFETSNNYYIVQELCDSGDFRGQLKKTQNLQLPEQQAVNVLKDILSGFIELLKHGVIHRDLKPENILIHQGVYKLADFGFAKGVGNVSKELLQSLVGTPLYMSPQILKHEKYTTKSDIWSIGMICYEMLCGKIPWVARSQYDLVKNIDSIAVSFPSNIQISEHFQDFIKKCLTIDEKQRITWHEMYEHPLFNGYYDNKIASTKQLENKAIFIINNLRQTIMSKKIDLDTLFQARGLNRQSKMDMDEFSNLMHDMDPTLSREEIEYIFNKFDEDGDNTVDFDEFTKWLEDNNVQVSSFSQQNMQKRNTITDVPQNLYLMNMQQQSMNQQNQSNQQGLGHSQDQNKRLNNIIAKLTSSIEKYKINKQKLFNSFDKSHNGCLDLSEFALMIKRIDKNLTDEEIYLVFSKFDQDGGGTITYDEFEAILEKYSKILHNSQRNTGQIFQGFIQQQMQQQGFQQLINQFIKGMQPGFNQGQQGLNQGQQGINQGSQGFNQGQQGFQYQQGFTQGQQGFNLVQPGFNQGQPGFNGQMSQQGYGNQNQMMGIQGSINYQGNFNNNMQNQNPQGNFVPNNIQYQGYNQNQQQYNQGFQQQQGYNQNMGLPQNYQFNLGNFQNQLGQNTQFFQINKNFSQNIQYPQNQQQYGIPGYNNQNQGFIQGNNLVQPNLQYDMGNDGGSSHSQNSNVIPMMINKSNNNSGQPG